ncbi:MAG: PAS domain S-box protein [Pedobacter sp.]|nr:MAG: PAS domain S-box protein [Pedobacter sp.]
MSTKYSKDLLSAFETLPGMYLVLSTEFVILTASAIYCKSVSKQREQIVGRYIFDVFPIREEEPLEQRVDYSLSQVITTRASHSLPIIRFDGPENEKEGGSDACFWQTSNHPVFNEDGELYYIIHQVEEVGARVIAENRLTHGLVVQTDLAAKSAQLTKRLEKLVSEIPARMATLSGPEFVYEYVNSRYSTVFAGREILGKPLLEALPELKSHPILNRLKNVYATGITYEENEVCIPLIREKDGLLIDTYFNVVYQPRYDENGDVNGIFSFAYDVTELVNARKIREENESELLKVNNQLLFANEEIQAVNEELNASNEELVESNEELLETKANLENLNLTLDEKVSSKTTALLAAREESEKQRERLYRFFMQAPTGICILDGENFIFELVNPHYQALFPSRKLVGKPLAIALPELMETEVMEILNRVYTANEPFEGHEMLIPLSRIDGGPLEDRYFNFICQPRHDAEGLIDGLLVFVFEVTEVVTTRAKNVQREEQFKFLLNAMPQQVWTAKPDGQLQYVNDIVCNDFGKTMEDVIGTGWQAFIHPEDLPNCLEIWMESISSGTEYMVEFRLRFADGNYRWHLGRALPLIEQGQIRLWVGTNTNIEVQKTNEKRKDEFLSIASHELKTPLTSIKAFNQLMVRAKDSAVMESYVNKSSGNILRLEKLIDDLLDVTKITAGKMQYDMEVFHFDEMVSDVVDSFKLLGLNHKIVLQQNQKSIFLGDRFRLEQVLNNFLSNAVKYSPDGKKVIVHSKVEKENLIVSVQDFGIGIAKADLSRLFERYYRVNNAAMRFEGLGLGLFIASEILKRHQGNFWIDSVEGVGSTFYFRLPLSTESWGNVTEKNKFYQDETVLIDFNAEHNRLDVDWVGHQNMETVKRGCLKILEMILRFKVVKILNNNKKVLGSWSDASEWVGTVFFPMMEKKGVHSVAWVYSPNAFSQLSAKKSVDVAMGTIKTQFFTSVSEAENWINSR